MPNSGIYSDNQIKQYLYLYNDTNSIALGIDGDASDIFKIVLVEGSNTATITGTSQLSIDPSANGNIVLAPNGSGTVNIDYATQDTVALYGASGALNETSAGTDGQVIIGATGSSPDFATLTSSGGSIVFTPGANTLNLESTGGTTTGMIQQVSSTLATVFSTSATIPYDDTIPQIGEGAELLTATITPTKSANILYIRCEFLAGFDTSNDANCTVALFQDATADALAATAFNVNEGHNEEVVLTHIMSAGTTSATTFRIRIGSATGADLRVNAQGNSSTRVYGGVCKAILYIYEVSTGITTVPSAFPWTEVTTTPGPTSMSVNNGYEANAAGSVGLTLPAAADFGDIIKVIQTGTGAADIQQNAGQTIHFGGSSTTTGVGGTLTSTSQYDSIELLCITTNTDFQVVNSIGNWTVV